MSRSPKFMMTLQWIFVAAVLFGLEGCAALKEKSSPAAEASARSATRSRGRTQLWAQNCMRCHNARSPTYYSDAEWTVAMHHMRVRAYLTTKEYESILEFLKAAN